MYMYVYNYYVHTSPLAPISPSLSLPSLSPSFSLSHLSLSLTWSGDMRGGRIGQLIIDDNH